MRFESADDKQQYKQQRKQELRRRNEPPRLTVGEEVFNAVTHGLGAALSVAGLILLLLRSDTGLEIMASCFYGISLIVLMLCSCLYHAMPSGSGVKRVMRRLDHSSIYLLIGGTFSPILLVYQGGTLGIVLFCLQWAVILCGITMIGIKGPGFCKALHLALYLILGWSGLCFLPSFYLHNRPLLWAILGGGVLYTLGIIPFVGKKKYDHCIWHLFVLAAALLHWFGIYFFLY